MESKYTPAVRMFVELKGLIDIFDWMVLWGQTIELKGSRGTHLYIGRTGDGQWETQ